MLLTRLGLGTRELRAWAMYDWANSAFQTTIIAAIFPIFFQKVAAADLPGPVATSRFAWATTWSILIVAVIAPLLGAVADYAANQEEAAGNLPGHRRGGDGRDVLHLPRRLAVRARPVRGWQRRRRGQHRVLRVAAAAPRARERARSRVVGRIRGRLHRRRRPARDQHPDDEPTVDVRPAEPRDRGPREPFERRGLVGPVLDSAVSPSARASEADRIARTAVGQRVRRWPEGGCSRRSRSFASTARPSCSCSPS